MANSSCTSSVAVETLPRSGDALTAPALTPPFARRGQTYGIFLSDPALKSFWHIPIKRKHATCGTFVLWLIPNLGDSCVQDVVSRRWAGSDPGDLVDDDFMGRGESHLPPPDRQDGAMVRVAGARDACLPSTQLTQSTTDPRDTDRAGDAQWYNTASDKCRGGVQMHTHRHGEIYIDMYIYTHTHRQTLLLPPAGMCVRPEGCAPVGDSLTTQFGTGDTSTDNKMNMNPKTSDTITQHGVTH